MRRLALLVALAGGLAGCGVGAGEERDGTTELRVTRDFGQTRLAAAKRESPPEGLTVLRLLSSERKVDTRYGGNFVQSIDGLAGEGSGGGSDWFYFVNGIEADVGAAEFELFPGDVVSWDYRRYQAAMGIPAIVGAYPEPFVHGKEGKRLPVRMECDDDESVACREVRQRLTALGVPVTQAAFGNPGTPDLLRVVVAPWAEARRLRAALTLEQGPQESGVFARFTGEGRALDLLDETGATARTAEPGTGLVAATSIANQGVLWLVTGVDAAGVERAAQALDEDTLSDAFAVAVTPSGAVDLPLREGEG